jgi:hypothetical protein
MKKPSQFGTINNWGFEKMAFVNTSMAALTKKCTFWHGVSY